MGVGSVPARHTDLIFAVIGEELGFVGATLAILLLVAIIIRVLVVGRRAAQPFHTYVCVGIASMVMFQMIINIGMCLFITSGISGTPLKNVIKEIWGPIVVMLIVLLIITFVPESVLFLPKMFGLM